LTTRAATLLVLLAAPAAAVTLPFEFDFPERPTYDPQRGFGYEPGAGETFSVQVPEGNYRVTLSLGGRTGAHATVLAEQRRFMLETALASKALAVRSFIVNVRVPELAALPENATGGTRVHLKPREIGSPTWDDKLTIRVLGDGWIGRLRIEPVELPTLFLAGDSTVTDQPTAPAASWGQMLPRLLEDDLAVANHAESGEALKSFLSELRLDKLLGQLRGGDWVMIQFGHNDQKKQWPQTYAEAATTYRSWLRAYIAEVRRRGATAILVSSPERRNFDSSGHIVPSLGEYSQAMRAVALQERVAFIDLNSMSRTFYEALGPETSAQAFADGGRDRTHFNEYGADVLARIVVEGLRAADPALTAGLEKHVSAETARFDPAHPSLPR
jgi:lysophospholipase L1-like esterase